jgi:hypothetical protein
MLEIVRPRHFPRPRPRGRGGYYGYGYGGGYPVYAEPEVVFVGSGPGPWRVHVDRGRDRLFYGATAQQALQAAPRGSKVLHLQRYSSGIWQNV